MSEIPNTAKESFLSDRPLVTTKDKVFEPSDPFRHSAELTSILRSHYATDAFNLDKEILLMFTDGGGDHITRISTQVSLIRLFIQLNLNMLIALRCCPTQSWVNPAERIMSILNLALQNCSLERTKMSDELEQKMKSVNNMNNLRNLTKHCVNLRESF